MASFNFSLNSTTLLVLLLAFFSCLQISIVASHEFQVGDLKGWVVPPSNDTDIYNIWASNFRFQVGDSISMHYFSLSFISLHAYINNYGFKSSPLEKIEIAKKK